MTTSPDAWVDLVMITFRRAEYVRMTLPHLLSSIDDRTRVWLWHNGDDADVMSVVDQYRDHPRVHRVHHSPDNVRLRPPTNWLWQEAEGELLGKVDDDCMLEDGWVGRLRAAHAAADLGVLGSWRFQPEDYRPDLAGPKTVELPGGVTLLRNHWVQGSGYLVPRQVVEEVGPLREGQTFTRWCLEVARTGRSNGWLLPFVHEEHLDDPRAPHSSLRTDEDLRRHLPLSAQAHGVTRLSDWTDQMRRSALVVQQASLDLSAYDGWRARGRRLARRAQRALTGRSTW
ncbi:glycosyltransferase family 2 protein [Jannaschia sp. R86511]|uniref:glycosyltransferase family 2 protein n=1 Tax=Jannaschia sp. R86511 TaxID=3093853 RepID=UPI0036D2EC14